jgi:hypothetical protein
LFELIDFVGVISRKILKLILYDTIIDIMIKTGSIAKKVYFEKEQREIYDKIISILGLTKENNTFTLYDLSKTPEKIQQILDLKEDISKYFSAGKWICFTKEGYNSDKEHIVLLRNILKTLNVDYKVDTIRYKIEKYAYVGTQKYTIEL